MSAAVCVAACRSHREETPSASRSVMPHRRAALTVRCDENLAPHLLCSKFSTNVSCGHFCPPSTGTAHTGSHEGERGSPPPTLRKLCALVQPFLLVDSVLLKAKITVYFEDCMYSRFHGYAVTMTSRQKISVSTALEKDRKLWAGGSAHAPRLCP